MWWWLIPIGYVVIGLVTIRVVAELVANDPSDDDVFLSICAGGLWPLTAVFGLCAAVYHFVLEPLAIPRRVHRQRRQERRTEIAKTQAREAEKAARDYHLPYPMLVGAVPGSSRRWCAQPCGHREHEQNGNLS